MSLVVVARADRPLVRTCQVVGHFLAHRRRRQPERGVEPLLGIWRDPAPLETVTALGRPPTAAGTGPLVQESFGHEGEWYACRLAADPGPPGEMETLGTLLGLLLEAAGPKGGAGFAPCFPGAIPEHRIASRLERLSGRFPDTLTRPVTQDRETGRLLPQPDPRTIQAP